MKERLETWLAPQNDERQEVAPLRQLGWAFLLAWVFCVFYTNAAGVLSGDEIPGGGGATAGAPSGSSSMGAALFYAVLPLAASVATLAAEEFLRLEHLEKRTPKKLQRPGKHYQ